MRKLRNSFYYALGVSILLLLSSFYLEGRKVTTKVKAPKEETQKTEKKRNKVYPGREEFDSIARGLTFMAYDKKGSAGKETFFVDNKSGAALTAIELEITYLNSSGKQIHRRTVEIKQYFPAGEMRKVDIPSWDTQKSFHYVNSEPSKKGSTPYTVRFRVLSFVR